MKQLALELNGYPRPIAWTLSEVDRAVGDRDRRDMLLTAFEEITRYIVLVQVARYIEYRASKRGDEAVERRISDLRRPSFGHYVSALSTLDPYLASADDPYSVRAMDRGEAPGMLRLFEATSQTPAKRVSLIGLLTRIVEIRNREKGHGYTAQTDARLATEHLQPALTEFLNRMPILLARPIVWIERIEYLDEHRWVITLLELMGTQRARRVTREVQRPGQLKKGFIYMWDGESAPLQLTPLMHLEQVSHDEIVYVLAGFSGQPIYQARGAAQKSRTPDQLLTQLTERAPFLLNAPPSVTTPRNPEAARWYRSAVDLALADGQISEPEAERLVVMRESLGLAEAEAEMIHLELGWTPATADDTPTTPQSAPTVQTEPTTKASGASGSSTIEAAPALPSDPSADEAATAISTEPLTDEAAPAISTEPLTDEAVPAVSTEPSTDEAAPAISTEPSAGKTEPSLSTESPAPHRFLAAVLERLQTHDDLPDALMLEDAVDYNNGELRVTLHRTQVVSVWFTRPRNDRARVVVGFYSLNEKRDPLFRAARQALVSGCSPDLPSGWSRFTQQSRSATLAFESSTSIRVASIEARERVDEVAAVAADLSRAAARAIEGLDVHAPVPQPLEIDDAPVAASVPDDFALPALTDSPRLQGSVWKPRILWALEWARRHDPSPKSAADIARILCAHGVQVPPTNTARAFRTANDDPRQTGLCDEVGEQTYVITVVGRRALFELLSSLGTGEPA